MIKAAMLALAALVAAGPVTAEISQDSIRHLVKLEQRGLRSAQQAHLDGLIMPVSTGGTVSYDKAWVSEQPKASGGAQWQCLTEALYFEARGESLIDPSYVCRYRSIAEYAQANAQANNAQRTGDF